MKIVWISILRGMQKRPEPDMDRRAAPIIQICARHGLCRHARVGAQKRAGARLSTQRVGA